MKKIYLLFLITTFLYSCKEAKLDHPTEGAGGLLIGVSQEVGNSVLVTNFPTNMNENGTSTIQVKLSQKIETDTILTITTENAVLKINNQDSVELKFTPEDFNIDQSVTLSLLASDKIAPIDIGVNFSPAGFPNTRLVLSANYQFSRAMDFTGPTSLTEETAGTLTVKLRKQPQANATVTFTSNSTSAITITPSTLVFSPENFSTEQSITVSINDIYNDNRNYTITGTSDSESTNYSISVVDNDYAIVDLSTANGLINNSGKQPSITIDSTNKRFFVVTRDASVSPTGGGNRPLIFRCDNLNGTNCLTKSFKNELSANSGYKPYITYDSADNNLYVSTQDFNQRQPRAFKIDAEFASNIDCSTDNPNCVSQISGFKSVNVFNFLTSSTKILFVTYWGNNTAVRECDRSNISKCTAEYFLANHSEQSFGSIGSRGFKYDPVSLQLFGAATGEIGINNVVYNLIPRGLISSANGQTSVVKDIHSGSPTPKINTGFTPDLAIDAINNRLIITTFDYNAQGGGAGRPSLIFCNKTMTSCTYKDLPGTLYPSYHPKLLWDSTNKKIIIITYNSSKKPYLHHCDESGENCTETDLSKGQSYYITEPEEAGYNFDAQIDTVNNRALLVFADGVTGKLTLLRFGLGGF
ncbi:MAG: hypothetical protein KBA66_13945 [Leptospiraceae bacterium]|nr:hypothetical protein [Leptospiraceae bacterium]